MNEISRKIFLILITLILLTTSFCFLKIYESYDLISEFEHESDRYEPVTIFEILKTKYYIYSVSSEDFIDDYRYGEVVGFLTENVKSQYDLMTRFPYGVFKTKKLISELKERKINAPYGEFNNNYLTSDDKLIYSDDSEMMKITQDSLAQSSPNNVVEILANNLSNKWHELKNSGEYGKDGLNYGKRGYSKNTLKALSQINTKHKIFASKEFEDYLGNGSILRAWVIGADKRFRSMEAFELGKEQSKITHPNEDVSFAAGVVSYWFSVSKNYSSKDEMLDNVIEFAQSIDPNSKATNALIKGKKFADEKVDPVTLFTNISGFKYDEFLLLLAYSFLYFDDYHQALKHIVHTTGDNDSLAFVLGAFLNYEISSQNDIAISEIIELP